MVLLLKRVRTVGATFTLKIAERRRKRTEEKVRHRSDQWETRASDRPRAHAGVIGQPTTSNDDLGGREARREQNSKGWGGRTE